MQSVSPGLETGECNELEYSLVLAQSSSVMGSQGIILSTGLQFLIYKMRCWTVLVASFPFFPVARGIQVVNVHIILVRDLPSVEHFLGLSQMLSMLCTLSHLMIPTTFTEKLCYHLHFTNENPETLVN